MSTHDLAFHDSSQPHARTAGMLWLVCIITGTLAFAANNGMTVRDDAVITATNIVANEWLFRLGFVANLVSALSYVGVTALLYHVLKPAGRSLSFAAAAFGVAGVAVGGVAFLAHIAPVMLLSGNQYLDVFSASQLQALALLALKMEAASVQHRHGVLRSPMFPCRLPDRAIHVPAARARGAAGDRRDQLCGRLADQLPRTTIRRATASADHANRAPR